ncbi:hypothetical protein ACJMK2_002280, partial [Sinanodonta woodiana]
MAKQAFIFAGARVGVPNVVARDTKGPKESKQVISDRSSLGKSFPQSEKGVVGRPDQIGYMGRDRQNKQCFSCEEWGHTSNTCPKRKRELQKT